MRPGHLARRGAQRLFCGAAIGGAIAAASGIRGIASESMPRGLYYSEAFSGTLHRGDTIEVCLPRDLSAVARRRGYLSAGIFCADGVQRIVKSVLAVPGDTVVVTRAGFRIAGGLVPNTAALTRDSRGRPLQAVAPGRYPVLPGTVWLFSTEIPESYDSRYFGPVTQTAVRRRFHPVWTEPHRVPPVRFTR